MGIGERRAIAISVGFARDELLAAPVLVNDIDRFKVAIQALARYDVNGGRCRDQWMPKALTRRGIRNVDFDDGLLRVLECIAKRDAEVCQAPRVDDDRGCLLSLRL